MYEREETEMDAIEFEDLKQQLARDIMRFLRLHPKIMKKNQNKEIYDHVREMRIQYTMQVHGYFNYEDVAEVVDRLCDCEVKRFPQELIFDQETLDFFRPNTEQGEEQHHKMLICLTAYKNKNKNKQPYLK